MTTRTKCNGVLVWSTVSEISKAFGVPVFPYRCPKCGGKGKATSAYKAICGREVAACNAHADLLDALKQAEPILDAASATAREDGGTMIPGARPAWDAVRAAIERITP